MDYRDDTPRKRRVSTYSGIFSLLLFWFKLFFSLPREGNQVNHAQNGMCPVVISNMRHRNPALCIIMQFKIPVEYLGSEDFTLEGNFPTVLFSIVS